MEKHKPRKRDIAAQWWARAMILALLDVILIAGSYFMALLLRFDFSYSHIPAEYIQGYVWSLPYWIIITVVIYYAFRLYHSVWSFAGVSELIRMTMAYLVLIPLYVIGALIMNLHMPRSYYFIGCVLSYGLTTSIRFSYRFLRSYTSRHRQRVEGIRMEHIMIIGAGAAGQILIRELQSSSQLHSKVCCVVDDNPYKRGKILDGILIEGDRQDIPYLVKKHEIDRIIFAIPTASIQDRKEILNICKECSCKLQTVPGIYQLVNEEVSVSKLRNVEITDLLGREQLKVNNDEILNVIGGRTVLVTGGGGSIGSELCRQIASADPKQLIIFEIYENNAYDIQQELLRTYPQLHLVTLIGSVRNSNRINSVMEKIPAGCRLSRRSPQTRAADGRQSERGDQKQCAGYIQDGDSRRPLRGEEIRTDFHRQGGEPHEHHGGIEAPVRDGRTDDEPED